MTATPAESYPRYSRRLSPSTTMSTAVLSPMYPTMPHISPVSRVLLSFALRRHPALACRLRGARNGERSRRHVLGDDGARAHVCAVADRDRRHEARIGADEGTCAHDRLVLGDTVVVAGDGTGAEI